MWPARGPGGGRRGGVSCTEDGDVPARLGGRGAAALALAAPRLAFEVKLTPTRVGAVDGVESVASVLSSSVRGHLM